MSDTFENLWQSRDEQAIELATRQSLRDPARYGTRLAEIRCIYWLMCRYNAPPSVAFNLPKFVEAYAENPALSDEVRKLRKENARLREELATVGRRLGSKH